MLAIAMCGTAPVRAQLKPGASFPALASAGVVPLGAATALPPTAGKVVLVDFWASWCAPCKASFPAMAKLHAEYSSRGFTIVAVSVDEKANSAAAFWKKMSPPFSGVHDRQRSLVQSVVVPAMPTSYLLDRGGTVRYIHEGFHGEATVRELRQQIESLLAESPKS